MSKRILDFVHLSAWLTDNENIKCILLHISVCQFLNIEKFFTNSDLNVLHTLYFKNDLLSCDNIMNFLGHVLVSSEHAEALNEIFYFTEMKEGISLDLCLQGGYHY